MGSLRTNVSTVTLINMISIIVPVYNVEKYINRCVDSILAQSYVDWELILVDDGSTDNSGKICDDYAKENIKISVFHKANGGVSSARNLGITKANGDYITFIDSDDWIDSDYLENFKLGNDLSLQGIQNGCHIVMYEPKDIIETPGAYYLYKGYVFGPVCKLYRRDVILRHKIYFDESLSFGEDILFVMEYLVHCASLAVTDGIGYHYDISVQNSLTKKKVPYNILYEMYVKHLELFNKILNGSKFEYKVMRRELVGLFCHLLDGYHKSYAEILKNQKLSNSSSKYLTILDKIIFRYFPNYAVRYSKVLRKMKRI